MSNPNDMAFPTPMELAPNNSIQVGLTKREYFAAMAMQGYCANQELNHWTPDEAAEHSIEAADALLVELAKRS